MFRRKDEFESDENGLQGSLLGASSESESETVSVLSPQQASQYQPSSSAASTNANSNSTAMPSSSSASFSSPSSFGQTAARPISAPQSQTTPATSAFRPANQPSASASTPSSFSDAPRRSTTESRPTSSFSNSSTISNLSSSAKEASRRVLTVGTEILLKGEITTCDRLVIEGKVDATVSDVHTMELAESGSFKGFAEVEYAEISGIFEGELIVKSALVIYSSGKVRGKITYGEIEIERGGELTGEIKTINMASATTSSSSRKTKEDKVAA